MIELIAPLKDVSYLNIGDNVEITGEIFTARDLAHKFLLKHNQPFLQNSIIYHCGPILNEKLEVISAGPTTSMRMDQYLPKIIKNYRIKAIIGKGGIGKESTGAMKTHGCVYLSTIGGSACFLAKHIKKVINVYKLKEFGPTEAIWHLLVEKFPATVTIDTKGNNIHDQVYKKSKEVYKNLIS